MNRPRIIPVLSIIENNLVKTSKFKNPRYLGDSVNAVKIFNGKFVDELIILDIRSSLDKTMINFDLLNDIASQAFMPLGYGGGINTFEDAKKLFKAGYEKILFSTALYENPELVKKCVNYAGSSSIVASIDIKRNLIGKYSIYILSGTKKVSSDIFEYLKYVINLGVGEVIINFIDRDGQMTGYDLDLVKQLSDVSDIPLIPNCGAGTIEDFKNAIEYGAHSVAASSMFVYYGRMKAVLINFPDEKECEVIYKVANKNHK